MGVEGVWGRKPQQHALRDFLLYKRYILLMPSDSANGSGARWANSYDAGDTNACSLLVYKRANSAVGIKSIKIKNVNS